VVLLPVAVVKVIDHKNVIMIVIYLEQVEEEKTIKKEEVEDIIGENKLIL